MTQKIAIIIGAGPAGLTAAYELLTRTDIKPIVIEKSDTMGGIARTVNYKGNRIDLGGHRFFSKSDRVMAWWLEMMPLQANDNIAPAITYQGQSRRVEAAPAGPDPDEVEWVMLVRKRKSRIYFMRRFFDYPLRLNQDTLLKLGPVRVVRIGLSYLKAVAWRGVAQEENLEQFFINRFGRELYLTFFKSYTEKVWGVPCDQISAEWGAQRVKGLSIRKAIWHFLRGLVSHSQGIAQKETETSLIEQFLYPKLGPGQMWEEVARRVKAQGGEILTGLEVNRIYTEGERVTAVEAAGTECRRFEGDYFFSTMPIQELVRALDVAVPPDMLAISEGLLYRDFLTVGLLVERLKITEGPGGHLIKDNWIYIQEPEVLMGRLQIFNNWSPYLVADRSKVWLGLEYFCYETDPLWHKSDEELIALAVGELDQIGVIDRTDVLDGTVLRMPKTYPAYFGAYSRFDELRTYLDRFENLFLIGRNGMHKYNNQDHSMLTAMTAVENIVNHSSSKDNIWAVNTEMEYHEAK